MCWPLFLLLLLYDVLLFVVCCLFVCSLVAAWESLRLRVAITLQQPALVLIRVLLTSSSFVSSSINESTAALGSVLRANAVRQGHVGIYTGGNPRSDKGTKCWEQRSSPKAPLRLLSRCKPRRTRQGTVLAPVSCLHLVLVLVRVAIVWLFNVAPGGCSRVLLFHALFPGDAPLQL